MDKKNSDLEYYKTLEGLKKVTRFQPHKYLQENTAGHCYMALMIANDIMDKYDLKLDKNKVLNLLFCHDIVEIGLTFDYAADVIANSKELQDKKKEYEELKIDSFSKDFDRPYLKTYFEDYDKSLSREALFAKLIDKLEAAIYILTNKCAGFEYNEDYEFIIHYTDKYAKYFPELDELVSSVKDGLQKLYDEFKKAR